MKTSYLGGWPGPMSILNMLLQWIYLKKKKKTKKTLETPPKKIRPTKKNQPHQKIFWTPFNFFKNSPHPKKIWTAKKKKKFLSTHYFFLVMAMVILSALVKRFSVFRMRDFFYYWALQNHTNYFVRCSYHEFLQIRMIGSFLSAQFIVNGSIEMFVILNKKVTKTETK